MRRLQFLTVILLLAAFGSVAEAAEARIKKVLPQFVDLRGRTSLSPSLYERDAYQFVLRSNPEQRSGIRFAVQWKGAPKDKNLVLRVQMRGISGGNIRIETIEMPVKKTGWFSNWSTLTLNGDTYKNFGELGAWRATIWDGETLLAEQKSFLW